MRRFMIKDQRSSTWTILYIQPELNFYRRFVYSKGEYENRTEMSDIEHVKNKLKDALANKTLRESFQKYLVDNNSADKNALEFWIRSDAVAKKTHPDDCIAAAKLLVKNAKEEDGLNIDIGALREMEHLMKSETRENAVKMANMAKQTAVELLLGDYRLFKN